jgi:hypothetical protein
MAGYNWSPKTPVNIKRNSEMGSFFIILKNVKINKLYLFYIMEFIKNDKRKCIYRKLHGRCENII